MTRCRLALLTSALFVASFAFSGCNDSTPNTGDGSGDAALVDSGGDSGAGDTGGIDDAGERDTGETDAGADAGADSGDDSGADAGADIGADTERDVPPGCGDGSVDEGEECDDGDLNSDTAPGACRTDCSLFFCGDGITDTDEGCDDGDLNSDTAPDACRTSCEPAGCGDGVVDEGESCDDANADDFDTCTNACALPGETICQPCASDDDCGRDIDICIATLDGTFCSIACGEEGACPEGTFCLDLEDSSQCVPNSNVCAGCADGDGDGFGIGVDCEGFDCDDENGDAFPGGVELCNGEDDDCDGVVDEGAIDAPTWYQDADGDGYGDDATALVACAAPDETYTTTEGGDCDDTPETGAEINPGAEEVCDLVDNDCSEETPDGVADPSAGIPCDGLDDDLCASGRTACIAGGIQCAETPEDAIEICDGFDNDCNPETLDGSADPNVGAPCDGPDSDLCAEGVGACVEGVFFCDDTTGDDVEVCNGEDDDCNGFVDDEALDAGFFYQDDDGDGFGDIDTELVLCSPPGDGWIGVGGDCNDTPGVGTAFNPLADEVCDDLDNDCDDLIDGDDPDSVDTTEAWPDADGDGFGDRDAGALYCEVPDGFIDVGGDCDDSATGGEVNPLTLEICDDGIDNDCDDAPDCEDFDCARFEGCGDFDCVDGSVAGLGTALFVGNSDDADDSVTASCANGGGADIGLLWTAPETGQYRFNTLGSDYDTALFLLDSSCEGEELVCNDDAFGGRDNAPVGLLSQVEPPLEAGQTVVIMLAGFGGASGDVQLNIELAVDEICDDGIDNDLDGDLDCLDLACEGSDLCIEVCDDGIDNDTDGAIDCLDVDCRGTETCVEICDNALDDTGEGLVDCEDPACAFEVLCYPDTCGGTAAGNVFGTAAITGVRSGDDWTLGCGALGGADDDVTWNAGEYEGPVEFIVNGEGATLTVLASCDEDVVFCDAEDPALEGFVEAGDEVVLVVDTDGSAESLEYTIDIAIPEAGRCEDEIDNDLDGTTDCEDPSCFGDVACVAAFCPIDDLADATGEAVAEGSTVGLQNIANGSCANNNAPDATYTWSAPAAGEYEFNTLGSDYDTLLFFTDGCAGDEIDCNDDGVDYQGTGQNLRSQIFRTFEEGEAVTINITGFGSAEGNYVLNILQGEICDDGIDNDGDELADCLDPDCAAFAACIEICDDEEDNDGDELTDCDDPECFDAEGCVEICDDEEDNNGNGDVDCAEVTCVLDEACCAADVFEPNTGVAGSVSTVYEAYLENADAPLTLPTGDVDSFRLPVCDGAVLTVDATFAHDEGNIDMWLIANGFGVIQLADSEDDNEQIVEDIGFDGDVFLQVFRDSDEILCQDYTLSIDIDEEGCEAPPEP